MDIWQGSEYASVSLKLFCITKTEDEKIQENVQVARARKWRKIVNRFSILKIICPYIIDGNLVFRKFSINQYKWLGKNIF